MSKNEIALREIRDNLNSGNRYGEDVDCVPFPSFMKSLYKSGKFYYWTHAGSGANRANLKELNWIIRVIFQMTPVEFKETYILESESRFK